MSLLPDIDPGASSHMLPPTPSTLHSIIVSAFDDQPLTAQSMSMPDIPIPDQPSVPANSIRTMSVRRSTRLSVASASAASEETGDIKAPPPKKRRGSARKSAVASEATQVKMETSEEVDIKSDITAFASTSNGASFTRPEAPAKRKRGRPSKASIPAIATATTTVNIKVQFGANPSSEGASTFALVKQEVQAESSQVIAQAKGKSKAMVVKTEAQAHIASSSKDTLPVKGKGKGKAKAKAPLDPKKDRLARVRAKCPKTILDRYKRATSQRMFMLERNKVGDGFVLAERFKVLGSTGNVYTINIGARPQCDCPDCLNGNMPCKHIIFVFIKVLKVPDDSSMWFQKSLTPEELEEVFSHAPPSPSGAVAVSSKVRDAYLRATGVLNGSEAAAQDDDEPGSKRMPEVGEDCPVCYDEMTEDDVKGKRLVFDEALGGCGKPLHKQCFEMWALTARNKGDKVTCVWCRAPWPRQEGKGKGKGPEFTVSGYLNMAEVAGMSRYRDVSTYHRGYRYVDAE